MAKQAVAKKIDTKVTKSRPRKGSKAPMIIDIATEHPDLTTREIGKLADCSHVNVIKVLERYGVNQNAVEGYKSHRAEILAGMQEKILNTITEQDIKAVPLNLRVLSYGILYDKERLERGQSTSNSINFNVDAQDVRYRQFMGLDRKESEFSGTKQNQDVMDDNNVIDVAPENG